MTNEQIRTFFEENADEKFRKFTSGLIPGSDAILGVRIPVIRKLARQLAGRIGAATWRVRGMTPTRRSYCRGLSSATPKRRSRSSFSM